MNFMISSNSEKFLNSTYALTVSRGNKCRWTSSLSRHFFRQRLPWTWSPLFNLSQLWLHQLGATIFWSCLAHLDLLVRINRLCARILRQGWSQCSVQPILRLGQGLLIARLGSRYVVMQSENRDVSECLETVITYLREVIEIQWIELDHRGRLCLKTSCVHSLAKLAKERN